jgi:serine/threonine protein kinase/Tol biopolymer transport system component
VIGSQILHYRILAELGQGGMGQVYRARDERLGREVALKVLPAELASDADYQARFLREARAASALNHPGIVTLHDLETHEGRTFLVMELVEGESFSKLAHKGVDWKRAVELVASVADALAVAHARGILHRDIKSDNLMLTTTGQPKVLDFGLAKLRDLNAPPGVDPETGVTANMRNRTDVPKRDVPPAFMAALTKAGQMLGTPAYMAPECFEGDATARSEVFALGIVLYELLTGKHPFARESEMAMMGAIMLDEPDPPSRAADPARPVPIAVDAVVARALAKSPDDRYPDMAALATALRALTKEAPAPMPRVHQLPPVVPRWWYVVGGVAALGIAVGAMYVARNLGSSAPPAAKPPTIEVANSRRITLDPGCEEYPRLHPDGKRVVYDGIVDGDYEIMVADLDTNAHERLTSTPGWDYASSLSPDGTNVAYVHEDVAGRTLRVAPIDGSAPAKTLGTIVGYPAWTLDGALLVGDTGGRILRRDLATGQETVLGTLPAGARLYHLVDVKDAGVALMWWTSSDADATSLGELDRNGHLRVIEDFATAYEGGLAAASKGRGYYATRKSATEGNQLQYREWGGSKPVAVPGISPGAGIDVSADGKRVVFSTCVEREYIVRITDGQEPAIVSQGSWQDTNPSVVDANHIIITSNRLGAAQGWLLSLDGKDSRAITPAGSLGSSPSPDGKLVAFATRKGLGIADIAGGEPRSLTTDPSDAAPSFTHDSKHVLFERTINGVTHVYVVDAAGGEAHDLYAGEAPSASPVDDTLVFLTAPDAAGTRGLMIGTLAADKPRAVPGVEAATWQRPKFSPDGKQLLAARGYQQLVAITVDGNAAPRIVWTTATGSLNTATWLRDGSGIVAGVGSYEGDLWLADGVFP